MSEVDWSKAPKGAMCFNGGKFWSVNIARCKYAYWCNLTGNWVYIDGGITKEVDYEVELELLKKSLRLADYIQEIIAN